MNTFIFILSIITIQTISQNIEFKDASNILIPNIKEEYQIVHTQIYPKPINLQPPINNINQ